MVKYLAILMAGMLSAHGFDYLVFNRTSVPVTNQPVGKVERSQTVLPSLPGNFGVMVYSDNTGTSNWNGTLPALALEWCKVSNNLVVAVTAAESNSIASALAAEVVASRQARELAAKLSATNALVNFFDSSQGRVVFAFMEATMDQFNNIRTNAAGNTNFPALTLTGLTNAIKVRINAQANNQ